MFHVKNPKKPFRVDGYYLNQPSIKFYGESSVVPDEKGNFKVKNPVRASDVMRDILYVYSEGKNQL